MFMDRLFTISVILCFVNRPRFMTSAEETQIVKPGELLKNMPPPAWPCYIQHGKLIDELEVFHPTILEGTDLKKGVCICEQWWPQDNPHQLMITNGYGTVDFGVQQDSHICHNELTANVVGCDSFEDNNECFAHLWMGPQTEGHSYSKHAQMKCTVSSSDKPNHIPEHSVIVYEVDNFDIGQRCDRYAIQTMLNDRLELYRNNSQFYRQIPVFGYYDFEPFCDPRIASEGCSIKLFFKCISNVVRQAKPESRGAIPAGGVLSQYILAGAPWDKLLLQGPYTQVPSKQHPLCVEEQNGILKIQEDTMPEDCDKPMPVSACCRGTNQECELWERFETTAQISLFCCEAGADYELHLASSYWPQIKSALLEEWNFNFEVSQTPGIHIPPVPRKKVGDSAFSTKCGNTYAQFIAQINARVQNERVNTSVYGHIFYRGGPLMMQQFCPNIQYQMNMDPGKFSLQIVWHCVSMQ